MPAALRLFIALPLPPDVRRSLWGQLAFYRERHRAARWLPPETWHLTLLFLGSVPEGRAEEVVALIDHVAGIAHRFSVAVAGSGGRVRGGDALAWLRVEDGAAQVIELASHLAADCPDGLAGASPPRRTPAAHVTVARGAERRLVEDLAADRWGHPEARWEARSIALVRSHLEPSGARYETLHEATLYPAGQ